MPRSSLITALVLTLACTQWKAIPIQPESLRASGETVRAHLRSGERVTLFHAVVVKDSIVSPRRVIPTSQVQLLEVRRPDATATTALVAGAAIGLVALSIIWITSSGIELN